MARVRLLPGDCIERMRALDAESIDSIVTDPPYDLAFMGKKWDATGIAFDPATWREALRILKPGGHLLAFGGTRTYHRMVCAIEDAGFEIRDSLHWIHGSGFAKNAATQLKPAHEPIVAARKPLIGTVAANILTHGTGGLNIDACRLEIDDSERKVINARSGAGYGTGNTVGAYHGRDPGERFTAHTAGRWPPNLLLTHAPGCERAGTRQVKNEVAGTAGRTFNDPDGTETVEVWACGPGCPIAELERQHDGASRFFPTFAWDLELDAPFFYCAKASKSERGKDCTHPTVKPIKLMRWLCKLVTPPGGLVLDPFLGSGTTGIAALREGFTFLGIEKEEEYFKIAEARIRAAWAKLKEESP